MAVMSSYVVFAFAGVGLQVFIVAWVALAILLVALLAAASYSFFRSIGQFDDELREATMDLDPQTRRLFYARYSSLHPKSPAVAWFLAVVFGPIGANLYRQKWGAFFGALVTLNGLGAWWMESIYTTPHLVHIENRELIAYAMQLVREDLAESLAVLPRGDASLSTPRFEAVTAR